MPAPELLGDCIPRLTPDTARPTGPEPAARLNILPNGGVALTLIFTGVALGDDLYVDIPLVLIGKDGTHKPTWVAGLFGQAQEYLNWLHASQEAAARDGYIPLSKEAIERMLLEDPLYKWSDTEGWHVYTVWEVDKVGVKVRIQNREVTPQDDGMSWISPGQGYYLEEEV